MWCGSKGWGVRNPDAHGSATPEGQLSPPSKAFTPRLEAVPTRVGRGAAVAGGQGGVARPPRAPVQPEARPLPSSPPLPPPFGTGHHAKCPGKRPRGWSLAARRSAATWPALSHGKSPPVSVKTAVRGRHIGRHRAAEDTRPLLPLSLSGVRTAVAEDNGGVDCGGLGRSRLW